MRWLKRSFKSEAGQTVTYLCDSNDKDEDDILCNISIISVDGVLNVGISNKPKAFERNQIHLCFINPPKRYKISRAVYDLNRNYEKSYRTLILFLSLEQKG